MSPELAYNKCFGVQQTLNHAFPAPLFQKVCGSRGLWLGDLASESTVVFAFNCHTPDYSLLEAIKGSYFDTCHFILLWTQILIFSFTGKHHSQFQDVILWGSLYDYIAN